MRYTKWDPVLDCWTVPCLYKPNGEQISFRVFEESAEVIEKNSKGQQKMRLRPSTPKVCGEAIDRLAELENQKETDRKTIEKYKDRLHHLLRSKTVQLFDEYDPKTGTYKRDIRRLDTYGIDKKVLEVDEMTKKSKRPNPKYTPPASVKKPEPMTEPPRRCEVDGKPATFHCWAEEDEALLQMDSYIPSDKFELIKYRFNKEGVAPAYTHIETVRHTFALVEYADGTVRKVEPEEVKFTDRGATE